MKTLVDVVHQLRNPSVSEVRVSVKPWFWLWVSPWNP